MFTRKMRSGAATFLALALIVAMAIPTAVASATPSGDSNDAYAKDRFLVKFKSSASPATIAAINGAERVSERAHIKQIGVRVLSVPKGKTADEMVARYRKKSAVEFAELDAEVSAALTPSDELYLRQWAPAYCNLPAAWDVTTGNAAVTIAILDTGVDVTHPELAGRVVAGYDFVNNDSLPADDNGHGTRVTGIAVATGNNGIGIAGVDWNARVLPVKVLDSSGSGSWSVVAQGITYAADKGAKVLNMSLAGPASATLQSAIRYANGKGCTIAAASGNDGSSTPLYPAAYPEVIAVGSVYRDTLSYFSNYGPHLDVVAPGETIDTIAPGGLYGRGTGTSAAAPFVAGLAGLMMAKAPDATPAQIMSAITSSARDLGATGWDPYYGWGHINAAAALAALPGDASEPFVEPQPEPVPTPAPAPVDQTSPEVSLTSPAEGATVPGTVGVAATAADNTSVARVEFWLGTTLLGTDASAPYSVNWNTAKVANGTYALSAKAYDAAGNSGSSPSISVVVSNTSRGPTKKK